jgi:hypothetical protein
VGVLLAWISGDYVVSASDYTHLGWRAGLLAGTILAGCIVATPRPLAGLKEIMRGFLVLGLVAGGVMCIGVVAGLLLPYAQFAILDTSNLAHPRRYSLFLAIHWTWLFAFLFGTVASCSFLWRSRGAPGAVRERQAEKEIDWK